jgi:hypothetical protein
MPVPRNNSAAPSFNAYIDELFVKGDEWSAREEFEWRRRVFREVHPVKEVDLLKGRNADTWQEIGLDAVFEDSDWRCWKRTQSSMRTARLDSNMEPAWTDEGTC